MSMSIKLKALSEVNKKIGEIQKMYRIRDILDNGITEIVLQIPDDERMWAENPELSDGAKYQKIKLHNYDDDLINLIVVYGKKGSTIKRHNHDESHILVCIEGNMKVTIEDKEFMFKRGESMFIKSYDWHQIDFIETSKIIVIYI